MLPHYSWKDYKENSVNLSVKHPTKNITVKQVSSTKFEEKKKKKGETVDKIYKISSVNITAALKLKKKSHEYFRLA